MIGDMIKKIRKEKQITKTELARITGINIGHITHIEKGERNPSHKALKSICAGLGIPAQQLMYTYDRTLTETQQSYGIVKHIPYNKVLAIDSINSFIECPPEAQNASIAIKVLDDSMEPKLVKDSYVYIEFNSPLNNNEIGLFKLNEKILIRKFYVKAEKISLKAENAEYDDVRVNNKDEFYIIGKVFTKK